MNHSQILLKLQNALSNKDAHNFGKIILSLSPKEIVSFSLDEVVQISQYFKMISFEQYPELIETLQMSADFAIVEVMDENEVRKNASLARFFYYCTNSIQSKSGSPDSLNLNSTAVSLFKLAELGIEENKNILESIRLCEQIQNILPESDLDFTGSLINEANARMHLAHNNIESERNVNRAIELYEKTRNIFPQNRELYLGSLFNEADARIELAKLGIDIEKNCLKALSYIELLREKPPESSREYCHILFTEADAWEFLADNGIETKKNLNASIDSLKKIRTIVNSNSVDYAKSLVNEGCVESRLAKIDVVLEENLECAIGMFRDARKIFKKNSEDFGISLRCEAVAITDLVELGSKEKSEKDLDEALSLLKKSRKNFPNHTLNYALTLINEAVIKKNLGDCGIDPKNNYNEAIDLLHEVQRNYVLPPLFFGDILMNEGTFRADLAKIGVETILNRELSLDLFHKAIMVFEKNKNGFGYSIAMIKAINASIMGYFDTGDTKYLEKGKTLIAKAILEFGQHKLLLDKTVQSRLHELKATICEYGDPVQLGDAAHEYNEAFNLSNDEYYKFMEEFCRTRNGEMKFCEFVERWKDREKVNRQKSDFMEEYFGYAIFECHIEKALKSKIDEEEELTEAIKSLEKIRDQAQGILLKERFDAYISLVKAVYLCLVENNYSEAKSSVKAACQIFTKYNEVKGIEICEVFHEAIISGNEPEAWRNAMSRCQPLTGNIVSLIYRYSDKRELNLRNQLYFDNVKTINNILLISDNKNKDRFTRLEKNINEQFDSTNEKIDSINREITLLLTERFDSLEKICEKIPETNRCQMKELEKKLKLIIEKGDTNHLEKVIQNLMKNKQTLINSIQGSDITDKEKRTLIKNIESLNQIQPKILEKLKGFGYDVSTDLTASIMASILIDHLIPIISPVLANGPAIIGTVLEYIKTCFI